MKKEVSELKELMVNVTKDLHEEIKAMWKYLKEEKSAAKNVLADQPENKCKSHAW